jgi:hypothetical protein
MPLELVDDDFEICPDCLQFDAGYDEHETGRPWSTEHPPWGQLMDEDGKLRYLWSQSYEEDGDEPIYGFSWSPCNACGDPLGGDRYEGKLYRVVTPIL